MAGKVFTFAGLEIPFRTGAEFFDAFESAIEKRTPLRIGICNANTLMLAKEDPEYRDVLARMMLLNDGVGLDLGAKMKLGEPFPENLNGTDLTPRIFRESLKPLRIYLLGGEPGIAEGAAAKIAEIDPRHEIVGLRSGFFKPEDESMIVEEINDAQTDLLLVAMGNPLQEKFIMRHADAIRAPVAMGVGALFDFLAEKVSRAPMWMQNMRIEFLHRLRQEPVRLFKRYTVDAAGFLLAVRKEKSAQSAEGVPTGAE
ncbi:WecB/TagA/CpsF family glycosyltransferase [Parvularcula sp. ZS-1/3]|uniref:WecB/TagA/CpsF family glycosyltransferase n=1 Tax=Parvularcula mediterranea TaxID=2732508 RepID=A0A7Y3RNL5_9PROT|nr:WecB/TagA/CpsF family glycosyltransferase [Parvularcula mediterranea]NNU17290.1 WecB/TagA/CpsF family glycosyltransferase [Parvularcula mediterranea]